MATPERPLSPYMTVYRPQITSMMSIAHRITGVILAMGAFGMAWWLLAVTASPQRFDQFTHLAGSLPGTIVLIGFSWCLMYHLFNGLRHLVWDSGHGFEIKQFYASGWAVIILSLACTAALWWFALNHGVTA